MTLIALNLSADQRPVEAPDLQVRPLRKGVNQRDELPVGRKPYVQASLFRTETVTRGDRFTAAVT
jgi:hypothetical protein